MLNDPAADVGFARSGVTREQGRAIEDDGDFGAVTTVVLAIDQLRRLVHLRDHVLQEEQRAIVDAWQTRAEAAGKA